MGYKSYSNINCASPAGATEILEKPFTKIDVFELLDDKKIGKLFPKYETFL